MEPPAWARALVTAFAPGHLRSALDGDLAERFRHRAAREGPLSARRWYASQALRSLVPLGIASFRDVSPGRWIAGALVGIAVTSIAPAFVDGLLRPTGFPPAALFAWYLCVAGGAALAGGYAAVRVAGVDATGPLLGLVWVLYAPALFSVIGSGAPTIDVAGVTWVLAAAVAGGGLSARRVGQQPTT